MILVSYPSVLIEFSFSHIGYCLNVFVWLWIIGFTCASLEEGVFFFSSSFYSSFFFNLIHGSFTIIADYLFPPRNTYDNN